MAFGRDARRRERERLEREREELRRAALERLTPSTPASDGGAPDVEGTREPRTAPPDARHDRSN